MQPTVLLHEAWEKLSSAQSGYESPEHFKAVTALAMRQILVDRARRKASLKRGADAVQTTLSGLAVDGKSESVVGLLDFDSALKALEALDPQASQVVILRTFGDLTVNEVAKVLETSPRTIERSWRFARGFLSRQLAESVETA